MKPLNGDKDLIKRQSRKFWNNFFQLMKSHESKTITAEKAKI
jgi:hypothetical protein